MATTVGTRVLSAERAIFSGLVVGSWYQSGGPLPVTRDLPQATAQRPRAQTATPAPRTPETRSHMPSSLSPGDTVDIDVKEQKLRGRLSADLAGPKETKAPSPDQEAVGPFFHLQNLPDGILKLHDFPQSG